MELVSAHMQPQVVVDYAHTPDASALVLATITASRTRNETLITVVGRGGNLSFFNKFAMKLSSRLPNQSYQERVATNLDRVQQELKLPDEMAPEFSDYAMQMGYTGEDFADLQPPTH